MGDAMNLKDQVLKELENRKGGFVSGNELAEKFHVSRNAVWKAVRSLLSEGHEIKAVTKKGYCLSQESNVLTSAAIEKQLGTLSDTFDVEVHKTLTSTNTVLKERAAQGAYEGSVIIAEEQTAGRGRLGRSFYSPSETGVYFSILLRPDVRTADATLLTTAAAVAVAQAVETVTGTTAQIKWVNDIFCNGKKVCGILTEGSFSMENGAMDYAVVGIGLNVTPPIGGFPENINSIAAAVCKTDQSAPDVRARIVAEILKRFWHYYKKLSAKEYLADYKERSMIIGKDIDVISGDKIRIAHAIEIDDDCRLVVQFEDGSVEILSSGEISIRPRR